MDAVSIEKKNATMWIYFNDFADVIDAQRSGQPGMGATEGLGRALNDARFDPDVRVVILTGRDDVFYSLPDGEYYGDKANLRSMNPLEHHIAKELPSFPSAVDVLGEIEKPVIACVNGDALGFGQAILWGCDMIVARRDAVIANVHLGQGDVIDGQGVRRGFPVSVTPGDGAMAYLPLYMSPPKLKEFLMLSRGWTGQQLWEMGAINYAVEAKDLDATIEEIVGALLARPSAVLARTKKVLNKRLVEQRNLTQDLSTAYEWLDFWQHAKEGSI